MNSLDHLRSSLENSSPGVDRCLVWFVAATAQGGLRVSRAHAWFCRRTDPDVALTSESLVDYGDLLLGALELSSSEGLGLIEKVATTGGEIRLRGQSFPIGPFAEEGWPPFQRVPGRVYPIGNAGRRTWPSREFIFHLNPNHAVSPGGQPIPQVQYPQSPVVRAGLPPIVNPPAIVDPFLQLGYGDAWNWQNLLGVTVSNYRVRIASIQFDEAKVDVTLEYGTIGPNEITCQASFTTSTQERAVPVELDGNRAVIRQPSEPASRFSFFVVDLSTSEMLDWADYYAESAFRPAQISFATQQLELASLLDQGEGPTLEWKGDLGEGPAIGEFFESVTAFANTEGGTIFVGVDDHGNLRDIDPDKSKQRIIEFLETRCEPPIDGIGYEIVPMLGKQVLVVTVPKGSDPPYLLKRDGNVVARSELYVRRGDKDRPARRGEIDQMYRAKSGEPK